MVYNGKIGFSSLYQASWKIDPQWNDGVIAKLNCMVQTGNVSGIVINKSSDYILKRVGNPDSRIVLP